MATNVALVSDSTKVNFVAAATIAAALQRQLTEEFSGPWGVSATINAFPTAEAAPPDYWLINIRDNIGENARGFHLIKNQKPIALVAARTDFNSVSRTCSHELLEMLVDPSGKGLSTVSVPPADTNLPDGLRADTPVTYLLEICDPCQAGRDSYQIDGVSVSDFCLPAYYNGAAGRAFNRNAGVAREVRPGGYVSFRLAQEAEEDTTWWQTDLFLSRLRTTKQELAPGAFETLRRAVDITSSRLLEAALACKPDYADEKAIVSECARQYERRCKGAKARAIALKQLLARFKGSGRATKRIAKKIIKRGRGH